MSKIDEVRSDMIAAMKAGDKDTKESLSMLLAALKNKAIDKREDFGRLTLPQIHISYKSSNYGLFLLKKSQIFTNQTY